MREVTYQEMSHDRMADTFAEALSSYDTRRRVEVLVDDFLGDMLKGKRALDVGCGLGYFSERAQSKGALVTATDIGPSLIEKTRQRVGCACVLADAMELESKFGKESFDVVLSSECVEHTPSPATVVAQMCKVLKKGGLLSISTPNLIWQPVVRMATLLRLRPFDGFENFLSWGGLKRAITENGLEVVREEGLHLFPFQFGMHGLSMLLDRRAQFARSLMINMCVLARKVG